MIWFDKNFCHLLAVGSFNSSLFRSGVSFIPLCFILDTSISPFRLRLFHQPLHRTAKSIPSQHSAAYARACLVMASQKTMHKAHSQLESLMPRQTASPIAPFLSVIAFAFNPLQNYCNMQEISN